MQIRLHAPMELQRTYTAKKYGVAAWWFQKIIFAIVVITQNALLGSLTFDPLCYSRQHIVIHHSGVLILIIYLSLFCVVAYN